MALDYSKLSTAELEAIANDDFSKVSTKTLRLISNEPEPKSITDNIKDFGKATASLADTGLNAITGMLDYAAYPLARAFGRSPEQATQETSSPKDVIGRGLGITQDPAYENELSRRMMAGVGQGIENYAVKPLVSATGLPEQDVSNMVGSAMLGAGVKAQPYINRAGQAVAQSMYAAEPYITGALKAPLKAPVQFGKGLVEGLVNKEYNPATSAMIPLRDTYTPPAAAQRFMGQAKTPPYKIGEGPSSGPLPNMPEQSLSQLESQARPTSELVGGTAGRVAQAISPKTLAGETLVPLQGQTMQAFGERVGRGVRTNPLQAMGEAGLIALTGIPVKTMLQGVGELGARYLGAKTGFMPGFSDKLGQSQGRAGIQGQMPQTPLLTNNPSAPGPVNPQTMFVSPEGVAGTNINQVSQAGAQQKYAPQPVPQTPQQMAVQKTQEIVAQQARTMTPEQQAIIDQIRARGNKPTTPPPPAPTTPVAGPIAPTAIQSLPSNRWTPAEKLALERANIQEQPSTVMSAADEVQMKKEIEQSSSQYRGQVVTEWAKGNRLVEGTPLDKSKNAYDGSNKTRGQVKTLLKAGIDEIPVLDGVTPAQTIDAMVKHLDNKKRASARQSNVLEMKIDDGSVGGSTLDQSVIAKRSFNENLEKYRYGSPKDPLTVEEYNHITNSDFIEKQNMFDSIKGMNPEYIEHSFWYKDKDGTVINVAPDPTGSLTITKIDKNNPNKETSYSKSNPDREDEWSFVKMESDNSGRKITESFQVKGTTSPRHEKLKNWPAEFTNSKYDME